MTNALRQTEAAPIALHKASDYILRDHAFGGAPEARGLAVTAALWRRRFLTRRHLHGLDRRSLADIGIDWAVRDREVGKYFWQS